MLPSPWLDHAWAALGVAETPGPASTATVLAYYRDAGHPEVRSDDVAWCAAFVGACLERSGKTSTRSLLARSYLTWGEAIAEPRVGAIAVLSRGSDPTQGHVGFLVGTSGDTLHLLGGNQSDRVCVQSFDRTRLLALRWPNNSPPMTTDIFAIALAHVLEMEGGYTDDPHDPGGPTNLGITLATYAAWKRIDLTAETFGALKSDLRALDTAAVTPIYRARYWQLSLAEHLPPALALMHFDASVNHGVGGAARMLQETCGVDIDGEIGPETLAAARSKPLADLIDRYAAIREARYRALPHFWRFGRGWLARITKTRAACTRLLSQSKVTKPMTSETPSTSEPKWWGNSLAVWGTLITALSTVLPVIGPLFGLSISAETIQQIGEGLITFVQAAGGLIGTLLALYGRARATQPLMRKPISVRL